MKTETDMRQAFATLALEAETAARLLVWPDQQAQRQDLLDAAREARAALAAWECIIARRINPPRRRDPWTDPMPGDEFYSPTFAGGATFTVLRRYTDRGTDKVSCRITPDDGRFIEQRGRRYAVASLASSLGLRALVRQA